MSTLFTETNMQKGKIMASGGICRIVDVELLTRFGCWRIELHKVTFSRTLRHFHSCAPFFAIYISRIPIKKKTKTPARYNS